MSPPAKTFPSSASLRALRKNLPGSRPPRPPREAIHFPDRPGTGRLISGSGFSGASFAASIAINTEPNITPHAHLRRRSGSGSHSSSFRASVATTASGSSNHRYQGAPRFLKTCRNHPNAETPHTPSANNAANVTLRPRQPRQNHVIAEIGFTRPISLRQSARSTVSPRSPSRFLPHLPDLTRSSQPRPSP